MKTSLLLPVTNLILCIALSQNCAIAKTPTESSTTTTLSKIKHIFQNSSKEEVKGPQESPVHTTQDATKDHEKKSKSALTKDEKFIRTKAKLLSKLQTLQNEVSNHIESARADKKVNQVSLDEADLKLKLAKQWFALLETFSDWHSPFRRAYYVAKSELDSALVCVHPSKHFSYLKAKLAALKKEMHALQEKMPIEDKDKVFITPLLANAESYIELADKNVESQNISSILHRADFLVKSVKKEMKRVWKKNKSHNKSHEKVQKESEATKENHKK